MAIFSYRYTRLVIRGQILGSKIAKSHRSAISSAHIKKVEQIIDDDEQGEDKSFGQRVGVRFHRGDFFVEQDDFKTANIDRFVKLIWRALYHTYPR